MSPLLTKLNVSTSHTTLLKPSLRCLLPTLLGFLEQLRQIEGIGDNPLFLLHNVFLF